MELEESGFLKQENVRLIGTTAQTIKRAEDRLEFKETMEKIHEPIAASIVVEHVDDAILFANEIGYPVVIRPAYTLGGSGGGIAHNEEELHDICSNGLRLSRVGQCLIERCIAGWKEIEYEVMRDAADQIVRYSLDGVDHGLRLSGTLAKHLAVFVAAVLKDQKKTRGRTRMVRMLKENKPLKFFTVPSDRLREFCRDRKSVV